MMISAKQCAAGRAILQWSEEELSKASGVSAGAIIGFESGKRPLNATSQQALRHAFEHERVVLLDGSAQRSPGGGGLVGITKDPREEGLGDELE